MDPDLLYQLALGDIPYIGNVHARILTDHFECARDIFRASENYLGSIEGIGTIRAKKIHAFRDFSKAEKEQNFIRKYGITPVFIKSPNYPKRLLHCYDPPTLLFYKGNADLNHKRIIAIVGTRSNSDYGKQITEKIVRELSPLDVLIVSGLAHGIDAIAHQSAIRNGLKTVGVTAHGLDTIYPPEHSGLAKTMVTSGAILTEFKSKTAPDKYNFPSRNRIVAGISDATIIIESNIKGGSMITADMASGYHRDVFAVPGRLVDSRSTGCNQLIANNKAIMFNNVPDMLLTMGWSDLDLKRTSNQTKIFNDLTDPEKNIVDLLQSKGPVGIDELHISSGMALSVLATILLQLELKFIAERMPGKVYRIRF